MYVDVSATQETFGCCGVGVQLTYVASSVVIGAVAMGAVTGAMGGRPAQVLPSLHTTAAAFAAAAEPAPSIAIGAQLAYDGPKSGGATFAYCGSPGPGAAAGSGGGARPGRRGPERRDLSTTA